MSSRPLRLTKPRVFALLMSLSALAIVLPPRCTAWMDSALQPLGWLQWGAGRLARAGASLAPGEDAATAELARLAAENAALRQQGMMQRHLLEELERRLEEVTGVRDQLRDGSAQIHVAVVLGSDASPRRQTLRVGRGSADGVSTGDWVAAGVAPGAADVAATGRELLSQRWLIGVVESVGPFSSRVQLLTDPGFGPLRVRAARMDGQTLEVSRRECLLYGAGNRSVIRDAPENFVSNGFTNVLVELTSPVAIVLPAGRMVRADTLPESALHFDIWVEPWGAATALEYVYILSSERDE